MNLIIFIICITLFIIFIGVPVSTQWNQLGYYYPTQIAQFGLSHYSKSLVYSLPKIEILQDAQKLNPNWVVPNNSKIKIEFNSDINSHVLYFFNLGKLLD